MIFVGIDGTKDKHDCFITNSDGEVLFKSFTITNNLDGFDELYQKIESVMEDISKVKVGLEGTGHYSYNLLGYLLDKGLATFVINPLHTNLYRKLICILFPEIENLFQLFIRILYMNYSMNSLVQNM